MSWIIQVIILLYALNFFLSVCTISFFGKILKPEIFQVKVGTVKMKDIQIGHKTRTAHANNLFEGVNHIVLMRLKMKKYHTLKLSIFFELWSNLFIFWVLPPFMAMFLDHNLWTTDPNFMFSEHFSQCVNPRNTKISFSF